MAGDGLGNVLVELLLSDFGGQKGGSCSAGAEIEEDIRMIELGFFGVVGQRSRFKVGEVGNLG